MTALTANEDGSTYQGYVGLVSVMITYLLPLLIANTADASSTVRAVAWSRPSP